MLRRKLFAVIQSGCCHFFAVNVSVSGGHCTKNCYIQQHQSRIQQKVVGLKCKIFKNCSYCIRLPTDLSNGSIVCMITIIRFPIAVVSNHPAIITVLIEAGACEYANSKPGTAKSIIPISRINPGGIIHSMWTLCGGATSTTETSLSQGFRNERLCVCFI